MSLAVHEVGWTAPCFGAHMNQSVISRRLRPRRGFSLLEMLTVVVLIGLLASISIGKTRDILTQNRVYRASTVIQTNVEVAWALAARNRRPIRISWNATKRQMSITDRAGTSFQRTVLGQEAYGLPPGSVTFVPDTIEVFPNGLANSDLLITLSTTGVTKKVRVSRAGLVQQQ